METPTPTHLLVGAVRRAVGLRGEVEVVVVSDDPRRFEIGAPVLSGPEFRQMVVATSRVHNGRRIVRFESVTNRDESESMVGTELFVPITEARSLEKGEFWDHEMVGCDVQTVDGNSVGTVASVIHPPANDVLEVVTESGTEHLIPLVAAIVKSIDTDARIIVIDPPEGLLG